MGDKFCVPRVWIALLGFGLGQIAKSQDSDGDQIPDSVELQYHMNPGNPSDASIDFDRDGLDALQEYQLSQLGKGDGPLGKWSYAEISNIGDPIAINDLDDILFQGDNKAFVRRGSDGAVFEISTTNGIQVSEIRVYDINNFGQVVGMAQHPSVNGGIQFGFIKDTWVDVPGTDVEPWVLPGAANPVMLINGINNWGDLIGLDSLGKAFFESHEFGSVSVPIAFRNYGPVFTALNDWGQVLGIETANPTLYDGHFLLSQGWYWNTQFPAYMGGYFGWEWQDRFDEEGNEIEDFGYGALFTPSLMNDWGEFAGNFRFNIEYEPTDGFWFFDGVNYYDGIYQQLLPFNYKRQEIHSLNNWPQLIVSGLRMESWEDPESVEQHRGREMFLCVGSVAVPFQELVPSGFAGVLSGIVGNSSMMVLKVYEWDNGTLELKTYLMKPDDDLDHDGMPDDWEEFYMLDPEDPSDADDDSDNDGYKNRQEFQIGSDPNATNIDADPGNGETRDVIDVDGDGLPDAWERKYFPSLTLALVRPDFDDDFDGLTNFEEWTIATNSVNADTDGDDLLDGFEFLTYGTDPLKLDTDEDGIPDGQSDADSDALPDEWEQKIIDNSADPSSLVIEDIEPGDDADGDGLTNLQEYLLGLNPYQADSDGDGYGDFFSVNRSLHLKLDDVAGSLAKDSSGKKRVGNLLSGTTWQPTEGIENGALQFDGNGGMVKIGKDAIDGEGSLTISMWFRTSSGASEQTLVSSANSSSSPDFAMGLENGNSLRVLPGGGASLVWPAGRNLADDLWHHVVVVRDDAADLVTVYLDGAMLGGAQTVAIGAIAADALVLGQRHQSVSTYAPGKAFAGSMDDVRIYTVTLVEDVALQLFRPNDLDGDGLPDDWESGLYGDLSTLVAGGDDPDEDGISNLDEFKGGTDPGDYYNGVAPIITLMSGAGQTILSRQRTAMPLVFLVSDGVSPLVNAPVSISHLEELGVIEIPGDLESSASVVLRTNSEGKVTVRFKAN